MAGEVIFAKLSQLEAFGTKVVTDFAALTARVQSLERAGGQPNIIEKILVNGIQLAVDGNKAVNFSVPTKTGELENDAGFQNGEDVDAKLEGKADNGHTHDDRYYTESEMNAKLNGKANSSHTHNYAGSGSAGGTANSVNGLTFAAQTTDLGVGSSLATNKVLIVYA